MMIRSAATLLRQAALTRFDTRSRNEDRPALGLYLVKPDRAAANAASTMGRGVEKSGSPTSRWMTSGRPAASAMISRMAERGMPAARREPGRAAVSVVVVPVSGIEEWPVMNPEDALFFDAG